MKKYHETNLVLTIYADDQPGLTGQLIYPFNRRDFRLHSLSVARTDLHDRILITLEAFLPEYEIPSFINRVRETGGVLDVKSTADVAGLQKTGNYFLLKELISKTGSDKELQDFYNQLEGPGLLGFAKTTLRHADHATCIFRQT